jgi:hypothetical protein
MESLDHDTPKEKKIGVLPLEIILRHSGLEVLQRVASGELPLPAMSEVIPFRASVRPRSVPVRCPPASYSSH